MPVPLTEGKAFHVPFVMGIVVSGIAAVRGAAAVVDAPNFSELQQLTGQKTGLWLRR